MWLKHLVLHLIALLHLAMIAFSVPEEKEAATDDPDDYRSFGFSRADWTFTFLQSDFAQGPTVESKSDDIVSWKTFYWRHGLLREPWVQAILNRDEEGKRKYTNSSKRQKAKIRNKFMAEWHNMAQGDRESHILSLIHI